MTISLIAAGLAAAEEGASHASGGIFADTSFWVLVSFAIVIGIFIRLGVHKTMGGTLDKRAQKIADELDEARRLREEAQELLAQYQRRHREAEEEAQAIIDQARRDAQRFEADAREKINDLIARRTKAAEEKIARAEAQALTEVRNETAELAIAAAREIIRDRVDQGAQSALAEKAIDGLRGKLN